jgi:hypothetical protein
VAVAVTRVLENKQHAATSDTGLGSGFYCTGGLLSHLLLVSRQVVR